MIQNQSLRCHRLFGFLIAVACAVALTACGGSTDTTADVPADETASVATTEPEVASEEPEVDDESEVADADETVEAATSEKAENEEADEAMTVESDDVEADTTDPESSDDFADEDGLLTETDLEFISLFAIDDEFGLDADQIMCAQQELVGTPTADYNQNFVDLCLGDVGAEWLASIKVRAWVRDLLADEELACAEDAAARVIAAGLADDEQAFVDEIVSCGFYGRAKLSIGGDFSLETRLCVDGAAQSVFPTVTNERADIRDLLVECGTEDELAMFDQNFMLESEFGGELAEELESGDTMDDLEDFFTEPTDAPFTVETLDRQLGMMAGMGLTLTDEEFDCARSELVGTPEVAFMDSLVESCVDSDRAFLLMAAPFVSFFDVEMTPEEETCALERFNAEGADLNAVLEGGASTLDTFPVACGMVGRMFGGFMGVDADSQACIDDTAADYISDLFDEEGLNDAFRACVPEDQWADLGITE